MVLTIESKPVQKRKVDLSFLEEMSYGDTGFRQEMINLFVEKIPNEADQLQKAFHDNDTNTVRDLAHNMKSSIDIFMLKDLSNYLTIIEEEAKLGQFNAETADKINIFHCEITEVVKILKEV
ncbi:hypothetical protein FLA105534_01238 [Flavobacterium bizetiae]|uniref:HPt domain-containing protein n=2 Tax=Flavobacterium bizetiae TaxID=2704140 RepID=A0A6J4GF56_9FLAO|nr:Hpt domain-containing protein [Flavobacterium bizetiae]CAA9196660.1 hypothetical protein FLA105534_01238 [Flavobacterium bizetiae]CAD5348639.1 hypothetical protein FLA105534_02606 [Flavobacterium bizetiae]